MNETKNVMEEINLVKKHIAEIAREIQVLATIIQRQDDQFKRAVKFIELLIKEREDNQ